MHVQAITLFPAMFEALTHYGVTARALNRQLWRFDAINPRDFADNRLGYIDDRPFGGGPGMIMAAPPLQKALEHAKKACPAARMIYLNPQGQPLTHQRVQALSKEAGLILLCGRYEGIDERILLANPIEEIAVGDFVVSGGELPAMMLADAVLRLVEGVLGDSHSAAEDSFANGLLDCPHYTRPLEFQNMVVPDILTSGNHALIAQWRKKQSLKRTLTRRPELLAAHSLNPEESRLLRALQEEQDNQL